MFFNIFIIMDQKIKNLIDQNVFGTDILDYDIDVKENFLSSSELTLTIYIDHYKLWRSSGRFDSKYYELIIDIDNGVFDESIEEFLPLVGYDCDYLKYQYKPVNLYDKPNALFAYEPLFDALKDIGYPFRQVNYLSSPWLNVYIVTQTVSISEIRTILEEEYDIDTDDIVMLDA